MLLRRMHPPVRWLMVGFTLVLAALLGLWTWSSGASSAALSASPATPRQNDTVTLNGSGFAPGETIAVWITYPDFRVFGVAQIEATAEGNFSYPYLPDFLGATFTPTGNYTYTARGLTSNREVYANITVDIGVGDGPSNGVTLSAEPGIDSQGSYYLFRGSGYGANEDIAIWLRYPDNMVEALSGAQANSSGAFEYIVYVTGVPVGSYALTARGLNSNANGIADFTVEVADLTIASGEASLLVGPSPDTQRNFAEFVGSGFRPGEIVTIWVTLPNYATLWIGDVQADSSGVFSAVLYLSEQEPIGKRTYTAFGNISGLRATADYTLQAGGGEVLTEQPAVAEAPATPVELDPDTICAGIGCQ